MKMHAMDTRLYVNAGMRFPACYAGAKLLDTDKSRLSIAREGDDVTCKRCKRIVSPYREGPHKTRKTL